ncbi:hypothetical protein [Pseudomonas sp. ML2-2023-3]
MERLRRLQAMEQSLIRLEQHNRQLVEQHQALQAALVESIRKQPKEPQ